jgi:hypothetical protein
MGFCFWRQCAARAAWSCSAIKKVSFQAWLWRPDRAYRETAIKGVPKLAEKCSTAVSQLVYSEAKELFVVFSQGKPLLANLNRPQ